jgi:hypothetical protein
MFCRRRNKKEGNKDYLLISLNLKHKKKKINKFNTCFY